LKKFWIILIVLVVLVGLVFAAGRMFGGTGEVPPTAVRMEEVQRGELTEFVSAPGEIQAKSKVSISAKTAAQIIELPFEEGAIVKKGDVLVRLDDTEMQARLRATMARRAGQAANLGVAQAQIEAAKARLASNRVMRDQAKRDLARQTALYESQDVSRQIVDDAQSKHDQLAAQVQAEELALKADEANLKVLQFQIDAADAEIAQAQDELEYTVIASPIDGVITKLNAEVGEIVVTGTMNNAGTVIMEVADLSEMIVEAEVDETDVTQVEVGQPAKIRAAAYDDAVLSGTVRSVSLAQEGAIGGGGGGGGMGGGSTESKHYICEVLLDPQETSKIRIFTGLTADVEIQTRHHEQVVRVPSQCVVGRRVDELPPEARTLPEVRADKEFTPVVYRIVNGEAVVTPVEVGASDLRMTIVTSGLEPGAQLVTGPFKVLETIQHAQKVRSETEADAIKAAAESAEQGAEVEVEID
jgi:HlyD family secretion protein